MPSGRLLPAAAYLSSDIRGSYADHRPRRGSHPRTQRHPSPLPLGRPADAHAGVIALGRERQQTILDAIAAYDNFTPDNDPRGEHDFGALEVAGERVFFKIDYYDRAMTGHSPDPADSSITTRMLTVMLAGEY